MTFLSTSLDSLTRESAALHIFGEQSRRVEYLAQRAGDGEFVAISEDIWFQLFVILSVVFYFVWIHRYINKQRFRPFVGVASAITKGREHGVHTGASRRRLGDIVLLWGLVVGIYVLFLTKSVEVADGVVLSYFDGFTSWRSITHQISEAGLNLWMLVVIVGFFFSMFWSIGILSLANKFSHRHTIYRPVLELRSQMLLYSVIYLMPFIILCSFGSYDSLRFYFALILVSIFTAIYLIRSFLLFQSEKISILLWILYLCTVEIFPATLVWALFVRS